MTTGDELLAQIESRVSTRHFAETPVPKDLIERLVGVAASAPSAHNMQPWRFIVVDETRDVLVRDLTARWRSDIAGGVAGPRGTEDIARSATMLRSAPVLLVVCLDRSVLLAQPDPARDRIERQLGDESVAAAITTLLLAAQAAGLAGCWLGTPLFAPAGIVQSLCLPATWEPAALVLLGYAAGSSSKPPRLPLSSVLFFR